MSEIRLLLYNSDDADLEDLMTSHRQTSKRLFFTIPLVLIILIGGIYLAVRSPSWLYRKSPIVTGPAIDTPLAENGNSGLYAILLNGKHGYIDKTGAVVIVPKFDYANDFSESLAAVRMGELWGFIDTSGEFVVPPKYVLAYDFSDGLAAVDVGSAEAGNKWGFIDKSGKEIIEPRFDIARSFSEDRAPVGVTTQGNGAIERAYKWGIIDRTGKYVIAPRFENCLQFSEGLAQVKVSGKMGYVNPAGNMAIQPKYGWAEPFRDGLAMVFEGEPGEGLGKLGFIDKSGRVVVPPNLSEADSFSEGLAPVRVQRGEEYADINGVLHQVEDGAANRHGIQGGWGYMDHMGRIVIEPVYDDAMRFSEGLAPVLKGDSHNGEARWGYVDHSGSIVIQPLFKRSGEFKNGLAFVYTEDEQAYIDKTGILIWSAPQEKRENQEESLSVNGTEGIG
jgi:hypothetical protein